MRGRRGLVGARALFLALLFFPLARAQSTSNEVQLVWNAPADCSSREAVLAEMARLIDPSLDSRSVTSRADVVQSASGVWRTSLILETRHGRSQRAFDAPSCTALASTVALILAIAADGGVALEGPAQPEPVANSLPLRSAVQPRPDYVGAVAHPSARGSDLSLALGIAVDGDTLTHVALGPELSVGWTLREGPWRVAAIAGASWFAPETVMLGSGERADFHLVTFAGRACISRVIGRFDVGPCAGAASDFAWASGAQGPGSFVAQSGAAAWGVLAGSLPLRVRVAGPVGVFVRVDGLVALDRPHFYVQRTALAPLDVYRPPLFAVGAAAGFDVHIF